MTNNGKGESKKSKNVYRKKINGSLYLVMQEKHENDKKCRMAGEQGETDNGRD